MKGGDDIDRIFDLFLRETGFGHIFEKKDGKDVKDQTNITKPNDGPRVDDVPVPVIPVKRDEQDDLSAPPDIGSMFRDIDRIMDTFLSTNPNDVISKVMPPISISITSDERDFTEERGDDQTTTSPRDQVLKKNIELRDGNADDHIEASISLPRPPLSFKSIFDNLFSSGPFGINSRSSEEESNTKFQQITDGLNDNERRTHDPMQQFSSSFGQSSSIRRIHRPDGSIEEVRTTRNSAGEEQRVVTRQIGDQKHSFIEKIEKNGGGNETEEIFENFDEKDLDKFNRQWTNHQETKEDNGFGFKEDYSDHDANIFPEEVKMKQPSTSMFTKFYDWWKPR